MKPIHAVWKDDTIVAIFEEKAAAYQLCEKKREELPFSCDVRVDKHVLFADLSDRDQLG
jgi:hypothetical protein